MSGILNHLIMKAICAWKVPGSSPIEWVQRPTVFAVLFVGVLVQALMGQQAFEQGHGVMALLWVVVPLVVIVVAVFSTLRRVIDALSGLWVDRSQHTLPEFELALEQRSSSKDSRFLLARARDSIP
jgi:Na+/melibiose symporter-like transporter